MTIYTDPPEWDATGQKPPAFKRKEGWQPKDRVPASWLNWFWSGTVRSLKEVAQALMSHIEQTSDIHGIASPYYVAKTHRSDQYVGWDDIVDKPNAFPPEPHNHNDLYYTKEEIDNKEDAVPPGVIEAYAGTAVPDGWLECNGQAVSRTTYSALFAAIGTTWGAGNGSTTFNVPDLRGEFLRGWDHGRGVDGGRAFGSSQTDAMQNITGSWNGQGTVDRLNPSGAFYCQWNGSNEYGTKSSGARMYFDASRVVRTASETRPRNRAVMYIIKY